MSKYIIDFQKKNGLIADGIIGRNTLLKMRCVFGIQTDSQLAHFLANVHHETGGFKLAEENLNYSAQGLLKIFPKYFGVGKKPASQYANKPEAIANVVYANRMGNNNPGDGWKYRGRGALQLTGKDNYRLFSDFLKDSEIMAYPDLVATKYFWESALFYFTRNNLWGIMKGNDTEAIRKVRKAVNGGLNGIDDVQNKFVYYYNMITR